MARIMPEPGIPQLLPLRSRWNVPKTTRLAPLAMIGRSHPPTGRNTPTGRVCSAKENFALLLGAERRHKTLCPGAGAAFRPVGVLDTSGKKIKARVDH